MINDKLEIAKNEYLQLVLNKRLSVTWPDHIIYDIILNERDGVQVPHVVGKNLFNTVDKDYSKPLDTWLNDNGY